MTITEFLLARIAEDEAVARAAAAEAAAPWKWTQFPLGLRMRYGLVGKHPTRTDIQVILPVHASDIYPHRDPAAHIARWDPARVLAECEAKRAVIAEVNRSVPENLAIDCPQTRVLKILGHPYADHPDFDPAWRV